MVLRRLCLTLAAALLATLSLPRPGAAAEPRWVPLGPRAAPQVGAVLPVGETVLAAPVAPDCCYTRPPSAPLLRTEDRGRSWTAEPLTHPVALAADPSDPLHLIASAVRYEGLSGRFGRVLESRDGGHTWSGIVDPNLTARPIFTALAIDPFEPRTLYAGNVAGFYRSDDGGFTWRSSNARLPQPHCNPLTCRQREVHTILPDATQAGRIFIRFNDSLYSSLNGGINWHPVRSLLNATAYALARDPEGALIVIGSEAGGSFSVGVAYRSKDGGATWKRLGRLPIPIYDLYENKVTGLAVAREALWVSTRSNGVLRSTDGGRTWKAANEGLRLLAVTSLAMDPEDPSRLFVTVQGHGIYTFF